MQQTLNDIHAVSDAINSALGTALDACGKVSLDLAVATSSADISAQSLFSRIAALIAGSESISRLDPAKLSLAPTNRLQGLLNNLSALNQSITEFGSLLGTVGDVQDYDNSSGVLSGSENSANVRAHLDALQTATDKALEAYLILAAAARPKGIGSFAAASNTLAQKAVEASELLETLRGEANTIRKKAEQLDTQAATVAQTQGEAERLTAEIEKVRKTAEENEQKILASAATAEEARSKATSVDAQVKDYEDKFTAFEQALETREQAIKAGQIRLSKLYQEPIAAAVFQELLANPATSMDAPAAKRRPNRTSLGSRDRPRHHLPHQPPQLCLWMIQATKNPAILNLFHHCPHFPCGNRGRIAIFSCP